MESASGLPDTSRKRSSARARFAIVSRLCARPSRCGRNRRFLADRCTPSRLCSPRSNARHSKLEVLILIVISVASPCVLLPTQTTSGTSELTSVVQPQRPWFRCGDVLSSIPMSRPRLMSADGAVTFESSVGPALLLTHDCAMDKRRRNGTPRTALLQFAPLAQMSQLSDDLAQGLRAQRSALAPLDTMYVGEVDGIGDCYISLLDPHYLPIEYFGAQVVDQSGHELCDPDDPFHLTPGRRDTRVETLDDEQIQLLQMKMMAFWSRVTPQEE